MAWHPFNLGFSRTLRHIVLPSSSMFRIAWSSFICMAGWEVSRHPEWDMMYAAGLTVREISDLCHWHCATIHRHFQIRERYAPGTRAKHETALAARGVDRPTVSWRKLLAEVLAFQTIHGRLPHHDGDDTERRLHRWVLDQGRAYRNSEMSASKIILLDGLIGWSIDTRQQERDEVWRTKLASLIEFTATYERTPRYQNHSSETERVLGVWLHVQHQKRAEGTLLPWRLKIMDEAFIHWQSRM